MTLFAITTVAVIVFIFFTIFRYNLLVKYKNRAVEAWSDVDVQLMRRYDLVPNLVETVKAYAKHEASTLEKVIKARNIAMATDSTTPDALQDVEIQENFLSGMLKSLFAVSENYPELKADKNFLHMQDELVDIEDKIKAARRFYNSIVRQNNIAVQQFPTNVVAKLFSFKSFEYFELDEQDKMEIRKAPKVSYN